MKTLPILPTHLFQILSPLLFRPTLTPTAHSVALSLSLNGWSRHIWCAILFNGIMDVHMLSLRTLMHVLCNKASSCVHWGSTLPQKRPPRFCQDPLYLQTVQLSNPLFRQFPLIYWFIKPHSLSSLNPSHLLKVTRFFVKISHFKLLMVTEKHFCL